MNSYLVYRASFYLMLVVASLALIGDSSGRSLRQALSPGRDDRWESARSSRSTSTDGGRCRGQLRTCLPSRPLGCCTPNTRATKPR